MNYKSAFIKKYSALTNIEEYKKSVEAFPRKSIRINTLKTTARKLIPSIEQQGWLFDPVPWCSDGYYISHVSKRRDVGLASEHKQGLFFVQKSVSMIPSVALQPGKDDKVLDMCAAPGGKTTHLAAIMGNKGIIVANEQDKYRINALIKNIERCGVMNCVVTSMNAFHLKERGFDKVLLDAPCSGSGLIKGKTQRSMRILREWNQNYINGMSRVQKKMIVHAYSLLKKGGVLVD